MGMGHTGGIKGYRFEKRTCPNCRRKIAVNHYMLGRGKLMFRQHNDKWGSRCAGSVGTFDTFEKAGKSE